MRRRRDLTGWVLMAVLFIGAMALIFYIMLMRAQHLARMEDDRTEPEARVEQLAEGTRPIVMHIRPGDLEETPHLLALTAPAA